MKNSYWVVKNHSIGDDGFLAKRDEWTTEWNELADAIHFPTKQEAMDATETIGGQLEFIELHEDQDSSKELQPEYDWKRLYEDMVRANKSLRVELNNANTNFRLVTAELVQAKKQIDALKDMI